MCLGGLAVIPLRDTSIAGSFVLIANGGTGRGDGSIISFVGDSGGGTAREKVFSNGNRDINEQNSLRMTAGLTEGTITSFLEPDS